MRLQLAADLEVAVFAHRLRVRYVDLLRLPELLDLERVVPRLLPRLV